MNGFSILMFIFGICLLLTGIYMYKGHKLELLTARAAFKNLSKDEWKNIGKGTIIVSIIVFIISIIGFIFNI